jgi:RNA polymerase primary sigma factor
MAYYTANRPSVPLLAPHAGSGGGLETGGDMADLAILENPSAWLLTQSGITPPDFGRPAELTHEGATRLGGAILDVASSYAEVADRSAQTTLHVARLLLDGGIDGIRQQFPVANDGWIAKKLGQLGDMLAEAREAVGGAEVLQGMIIRRLRNGRGADDQGTPEADELLRTLFAPAVEAPSIESAAVNGAADIKARPTRSRRGNTGRAAKTDARRTSRKTKRGRQETAATENGYPSDDIEDVDEAEVARVIAGLQEEYGEDGESARSTAPGSEQDADEEGYLNMDLVRLYLKQIGRSPLLEPKRVTELCKQIEAGLYAEKILEVSGAMVGSEIPASYKDELVEAAYSNLMKSGKRKNDGAKPITYNPVKLEKAEKLVDELIEGVRPHLVPGDDGGLSLPEELAAELTWLAEAGTAAKQLLIESNLRLVVYFAKRRSSKRMQFLDFIQEGNLGLIRAVEKYEYKRNVKFSSYAGYWIKQFMTRGCDEFEDTIRIPAHVHMVLRRLSKVEAALRTETGHEPEISETATAMGMSEEKVAELIQQRADTLSLDRPLNGDTDSTLHDTVAERMEASDTSGVDGALSLAHIEGLFEIMQSCLSETELIVVQMSFGLSGSPVYSQKEIADKLHIGLLTVRGRRTRLMLKLLHPSSPVRPIIMESLGLSAETIERVRAECLGVGLFEMFRTPSDKAIMSRVCGNCAMRTQCELEGMALGLQVGTKAHHQYGIWGGKSPRQRKGDMAENPDLLEAAKIQSPLVAALSQYA